MSVRVGISVNHFFSNENTLKSLVDINLNL